MESHILGACQHPLQRRHFRRRQLLQAGDGGLPAKALFRQHPIQAEVAGPPGHSPPPKALKPRIPAFIHHPGPSSTAAGASVSNVLIEHMLLTHFQLGLGFADRINVHLNGPLAVLQSGAASTASAFGSFSGVAVGDIRVGARARIFGHADRDAVSLHIGGNFFVNSGLFGIDGGNATTFTNVSDNRFRGKVDLTLAGRASILRYSLGLGFHYRDVSVSFQSGAARADGHEAFANAGLGVALLDDRLTVGAEAWMATGVSNFFGYPWTNAEVIGGVPSPIADTPLTGPGAGPGLTQGPGAPTALGLFQPR